MRDGIRIGRLFGIDIIVDYSWVFLFVLMSWNLTAAFGEWHPGWTLLGCLALAIVAALCFFASILAHELAHSRVAKAFGIPVLDIRLFLFGGVSNIEREPPSAKAELWMAIVGPLTSLVLGMSLLVAGTLLVPEIDPGRGWEVFASLGPLSTLMLWLGAVNLCVGVFNLVPGFPLDGGRVLRAALWAVEGDLHKATLQAASVGQAIGWTFMIGGIAMFFGAHIPLFGHGTVSALWLVLVGWFLSSASRRSYESMVLQDILEGVRVVNLMRRRGYSLSPETTVLEAVHGWFMPSAEHAFPVVADGRLIGLVCTGDVRKAPEHEWSRSLVTDIMTPTSQLTLVTPTEDASSALRKLARIDVEQLPVVEGGRLVGMLERRDIARWLELRVDHEHIGGARHA